MPWGAPSSEVKPDMHPILIKMVTAWDAINARGTDRRKPYESTVTVVCAHLTSLRGHMPPSV